MLNVILAVLATLVIVAPVTYLITTNYQKKNANSKISNAEEKARAIIDEALVAARRRSVKAYWRSRKNLSKLRMSLIKRSKIAVTIYSVMNVVYSRRKKTSIARPKPLRKRKLL